MDKVPACDNCGSTIWLVMRPGQDCDQCEEDEYGQMCEYCGGSLNLQHPEACYCDGEDSLDQHAHREYFGE